MDNQSMNQTVEVKQRDNRILCENIHRMAELIKDDKRVKGESWYTMEDAYKELGITYTSYRRWKNEPEHLIAKRSLDPLFKNYMEKFTPALSSPEDLIEKDVTKKLQLINNINADFLKLFCNTYNVYYYSDHVSEEIHFGRLRLFVEGDVVSAKLVIGIPRPDGIYDADLNKVFERDSNSFAEFQEYRKKLKRIDERYCYYYYGVARISAPMLILTMFGRDRNNNINDHKIVVLVNIKKIISRQKAEPDKRPYFGGMSMVISLPNEKHTNLRIFKMGISKWELPSEGLEMFGALLRHDHEENHRIVMSENDDRAWFHCLAKYQEQ